MASSIPRNSRATSRSSPRPAHSTQDQVTVLFPDRGRFASKTWSIGKDGKPRRSDFNAGMFFEMAELSDVTDIFSLSELLSELEVTPNAFVIRGAPNAHVQIGQRVRRKKVNFSTPQVGRRWVLIDIDKYKLPAGMDLKIDHEEVIEYLISLLPAEFHDVTYHWQMSSSAGFGKSGVVSMHLWFYFESAIHDDALKTWAKSVNAQYSQELIDTRLFNDVQPHYTAAPRFIGIDDPFPTRSGLVLKAQQAVTLAGA